MQKILLTGGSGMVGANILEHKKSNLYHILSPNRSEVNLLQYEQVQEYIGYVKPDFIIHAAGKVGGIQANIKEPLNFFIENLEMGKNVILAAYHSGVDKLLNMGSSCMYPKNYLTPLCESQILSGLLEPTNEGYALAKINCAKLCEYISIDQSYKYKTIIPCNIYGRHDSFLESKSHLIPAIIAKLHKSITNESLDQNVTIWGDGTARREFMYSEDLADCIYQCIEKFDTLPFLMNVGLGYDYTINEYYHVAAEVIGFSGNFDYDTSKPSGMKRKLVAIDKQLEWGWKAQYTLEEGIQKTYEFFLSNLQND